MIEDNNIDLLRLCHYLNQIKKQELKTQRAEYKTSYYRKIKQAVTSTDPVTDPPDGYAKWKDDLLGLNKRIEEARLNALKERAEMLDIRRRLNNRISKNMSKVDGAAIFRNGIIVGIMLGKRPEQRVIPNEKFADLADEFEATMAMNKLFHS